MNRWCIAVALLIAGAVLILDEIWMLMPGVGSPGWLIGDWSWMHVEPFHHWMLGVVLVLLGWRLLR